MDGSIRQLSRDDAPLMASLHRESFNRGWSEADMAEHTGSDIVLGYGNPISGFLIIRTAADQAEIITIAVAKAVRGCGLGRKLLAAGEEKAADQGVDIIFLEVAEDNGAAIALYRKAGYQAFGRRPAYYRRPQGRIAALTFRKRLDALGGAG